MVNDGRHVYPPGPIVLHGCVAPAAQRIDSYLCRVTFNTTRGAPVTLTLTLPQAIQCANAMLQATL